MIIREKLVINTIELGNKLPKLASLFKYENPDFIKKRAMRVSVKDIEPTLYHYLLIDGPVGKQLVLPRGGIEKVKKFYKENNLPLRILDKRVTSPKTIDWKMRSHSVKTGSPLILSNQQLQIINILESNEGGLIQASPGMGKTFSMLGLIERIKQPTLIIMHEHRLRSQWEAEVKDKIEGNFKLGRLDGDKKVEGDVIIGLFQTATKIMDEDPLWFEQFGMVIYDECHRTSSETYNKLVTNIPAKYRIGITGTVKRSDGLELLIFDMFGKILIDIDENQVKERITDFEPLMFFTEKELKIPTRRTYQDGVSDVAVDPTKTLNMLCADTDRNTMIVQNIMKDIKEGYFPLVLSARVEHCSELYYTLTDIGINTVLLTSKTRRMTKWEDIKEDLTVQCIIAIDKIASEGLDLPRLSSIHLTCPTTNESQIRQRIARVRRSAPGKLKPRVWDYVDNGAFFWRKNKEGEKVQIFRLKEQGLARRRYFKKILEEYAEA